MILPKGGFVYLVTGTMYAGKTTELIRTLWNDQELCKQMGEAGQKKVVREYSGEVYYHHLIRVYEKVLS